MSVSTAYSPSLPVTSPMAIPATGRVIGTPASISDSVLEHTLPIDVLPFEPSTSETSLIVYGKSSSLGITGAIARSASAPCPISRRPGVPIRRASPTENGGKL